MTLTKWPKFKYNCKLCLHFEEEENTTKWVKFKYIVNQQHHIYIYKSHCVVLFSNLTLPHVYLLQYKSELDIFNI